MNDLYDVGAFVSIMLIVGVIMLLVNKTSRKKHQWFEVDSSDIAHTQRLKKKKGK